jgi:Recombination endonuclease VII
MKCANSKCQNEIVLDKMHTNKAFCSQRCRNQKRHSISDRKQWSVRHKRWYQNHKKEQRQRVKNSPKRWNRHCMKNYGITEDQYWQIFADQSGKCCISGLPPKPGTKLCIDHDHRTGKVRGLVRREINSALGAFQDNVEWLQKAIAYLQRGGG